MRERRQGEEDEEGPLLEAHHLHGLSDRSRPCLHEFVRHPLQAGGPPGITSMPMRGTTSLQRPHAISLPTVLLRATRLWSGQIWPHHPLRQTLVLPQEKRPSLSHLSTGDPRALQARIRTRRLRAARTRLRTARNAPRKSRRLTPGVNYSASLLTNRRNRLGCLMDAGWKACKLLLLSLPSTRSQM